MLLDFMPVRRFDRAAVGGIGAREGAPGPIRSLVVSGGVFVGQNLDRDEIGEFFIPFIAKEQRLAAIADENEGVVRN